LAHVAPRARSLITKDTEGGGGGEPHHKKPCFQAVFGGSSINTDTSSEKMWVMTRHSCRFSVNHSLVSAGGQTFWTVKRAEPRLGNKRRALVSRPRHFNCIVPVQVKFFTFIAPGNMTGYRSWAIVAHVVMEF